MINLPMNRRWLSLMMALFIHFIVLSLLPSWLGKQTEKTTSEAKSVMITMTYKAPEITRIPSQTKQSSPQLIEKKITPIPKTQKGTRSDPAQKAKKKSVSEIEPLTPGTSAKEQAPLIGIKPSEKATNVSQPLERLVQKSGPPEQKPIQHSVFNSDKQQKNIDKEEIKTILVTDSEYLRNPKPVYPKIAIKRGYEGLVELVVLISTEGRALKIKIRKSSGYEILDQQAMNTVKNWTFIPRREDDRAVETWMMIPVHFKLN